MKKRTILIIATVLVVLAIAVPLGGAAVGMRSQPEATAPEQIPWEIPDLFTLLNYGYPTELPVQIRELEEPERSDVIALLMERPETRALAAEMEAKGFVFDPAYVLENAVAMYIEVQTPPGAMVQIDAMTVPLIAHELSAALTAMQPRDQTEGFYQAHHTNLDPNLAGVPDPPIIVNGMPYFYITTLRWINGRILYWRYWWFDSHHHPNWYYAHYYWYWKYYGWYGARWHDWYWWVHGWYYWRYWYYWSTWFPWYMPVDVPVQ
jgi:hypothetical protein